MPPDRSLADLRWDTNAVEPGRFVAIHGERALVDGYDETGLEAWAYPIEVLDGYTVSFRHPDSVSDLPGSAILRRIETTPDSVTRFYLGPDFLVQEHIFAPRDAPGAIFTYSVESRDPIDITVRFRPVLDAMWPAGLGGQSVRWDAAQSAYILEEPTHRFSARVGSPQTVAHDEIANDTRRSSFQRPLAFTMQAEPGRPARLVLAAQTGPQDNLAAIAHQLMESGPELQQDARAHSDALRPLAIETPDSDVNRALAWAQVALDQAWVCNPQLGCGLVAGYGPSRGSRRPQYAWFFAGDALIAIHALVREGDYDRARQALEFILRYQDQKTGMIWHELSQSAGLLNWSAYPYMFVHVDISFDFLAGVADYVAASGDRGFVAAHWSSISAAYRYCQLTIDPATGLPRIPTGKEAGNEQDRLRDELSLSAEWALASQGFSQLADLAGHPAEGTAARAAQERARQAIPEAYWSSAQRFPISGHTVSGAPVIARSSHVIGALDQQLFPESETAAALDQLASAAFLTDWGMRSMATDAPGYDPDSYAKGSVWATGTARAAEAFWSAHRPDTAFPLWRSLVPWFSLDSLGHMDEVLAGNVYHPERESVPEQTWSSATFLSSFVDGLLGLRLDGVHHRLTFAPHLPSQWNSLTVRHITLRPDQISFQLKRLENRIDLALQNSGAPAELRFTPTLPLGAQHLHARFQARNVPVRLLSNPSESSADLRITIPHGTSTLALFYRGGVLVRVPESAPQLGDPSRGIRLVSTSLHGAELLLTADASPLSHSLELRTESTPLAFEGASLTQTGPDRYQVDFNLPSSPAKTPEYRRVQARIKLQPTPDRRSAHPPVHLPAR